MKLCDDGHDEICFEGHFRTPCPLCEALQKVHDLDEKVDTQTDEIRDLKADLSLAEDEIENLKNEKEARQSAE